MKLDWNQQGAGVPPPGTYLAEVKSATEKTSSKGDPMFSIEFKTVPEGKILCFDSIMVAGNGAGIGLAKLAALGVPEGTPDLEGWQLVGRRVSLALIHEVYEGRTRLRVDIKGSDHAGYIPVVQPVAKEPDFDNAEPMNADRVPF